MPAVNKTTAAALLLLTAACTTGVDSTLDSAFRLRRGQSATIEDTRLTITFLAVDDTRCPLGVFCIVPGNGQVQLEIQNGVVEYSVQLNTGEGPHSATVGPYLIELKALDPYPVFGHPTPLDRYEAELRVTAE